MSESIEDLQAELLKLQAELAAAQLECSSLREKLNAALDGTGLCIWQCEPPSGKLTLFNLQDFAAGEMAPNFEAFVGKLSPEDKAATLASLDNHLAGLTPCYEAEYRTLRSDGSVTWLWDRGRVVERDAAGHPLRIMGAHVDISRRKEYERKLELLANIDELTGLFNRRHLTGRLREETERANRTGNGYVLAMLDIDHFKNVNDTHGHDVGDLILIEVSRAMEGSLREYDLCGRWGGEEFLLALPDTTLDIAHAVITRVHQCIRERQFDLAGNSQSITVSIGLSAWREGEAFAQTLHRADAALLEAKRKGRDRVLCGE